MNYSGIYILITALLTVGCTSKIADVTDKSVNEGWLYCNSGGGEEYGTKLYINKNDKIVILFNWDTSFDLVISSNSGSNRPDGLAFFVEFTDERMRYGSRGLVAENIFYDIDYKNRLLTIGGTNGVGGTEYKCIPAPAETLIPNGTTFLGGRLFSIENGIQTKPIRNFNESEAQRYGKMTTAGKPRNGPRFGLNGNLYIKENIQEFGVPNTK